MDWYWSPPRRLCALLSGEINLNGEWSICSDCWATFVTKPSSLSNCCLLVPIVGVLNTPFVNSRFICEPHRRSAIETNYAYICPLALDQRSLNKYWLPEWFKKKCFQRGHGQIISFGKETALGILCWVAKFFKYRVTTKSPIQCFTAVFVGYKLIFKSS